jgi:hypothetical protein
MPVRFLKGIGVAIGIKVVGERDGDSTAGARKAKVGPNAGSSLASGDFDAAGHATERVEKGPQI